VTASPVAARIAAEHKLDLTQIKPQGGRVQKEDVLAYLAAQAKPAGNGNGRTLASPKARRLAQERGLELHVITGSGPEGAVLAADVEAFANTTSAAQAAETSQRGVSTTMPRLWRVMVDRLTTAWATIPHFYLQRDVDATALMEWQANAQRRTQQKITVTDLLVKLTASALGQHPRVNGSWHDGEIILNGEINIGLAVAVEDGLLVPVVYQADKLGLNEIAAKRQTLVSKAQANKLLPDEMSGGTFTISNLGMYGVDQFKAIVNPPQAAILAVGRIADRVVPVNGQPAVRSMLTLSLSCDHRVVDGARGAQFLQTLAELIESPLRLLD
jgi:pyruvate dehydrogenase E2 component (dihydrolipoamide acetyltransferase)